MCPTRIFFGPGAGRTEEGFDVKECPGQGILRGGRYVFSVGIKIPFDCDFMCMFRVVLIPFEHYCKSIVTLSSFSYRFSCNRIPGAGDMSPSPPIQGVSNSETFKRIGSQIHR